MLRSLTASVSQKNVALNSGFTLDTHSLPEWKALCLFNPMVDITFFLQLLFTSSFATVTIATATRGRHLTMHVNMGCNKFP